MQPQHQQPWAKAARWPPAGSAPQPARPARHRETTEVGVAGLSRDCEVRYSMHSVTHTVMDCRIVSDKAPPSLVRHAEGVKVMTSDGTDINIELLRPRPRVTAAELGLMPPSLTPAEAMHGRESRAGPSIRWSSQARSTAVVSATPSASRPGAFSSSWVSSKRTDGRHQKKTADDASVQEPQRRHRGALPWPLRPPTPVSLDEVPTELRDCPQWVCWRREQRGEKADQSTRRRAQRGACVEHGHSNLE